MELYSRDQASWRDVGDPHIALDVESAQVDLDLLATVVVGHLPA